MLWNGYSARAAVYIGIDNPSILQMPAPPLAGWSRSPVATTSPTPAALVKGLLAAGGRWRILGVAMKLFVVSLCILCLAGCSHAQYKEAYVRTPETHKEKSQGRETFRVTLSNGQVFYVVPAPASEGK